MQSFVVIYYGGSGSSWLVHTLSSAPAVLIPAYEPLESWHWSASDAEKLAWLDAAFSPGPERETWLGHLRRSPQFQGLLKEEFTHVGLKMTVEAVKDHRALLDLLRRHGTTVVMLTRHNRLKHALALYRMHEEQRDQFNLERAARKTRLRMRAFDRWLTGSERWHQLSTAFRAKAARHLGESSILDVEYEAFVDDGGKHAVVAHLADSLRLEPATISFSRYRKATPDRLQDAVVNYRRLRRRYTGTAYERFLEERVA